MIKYIMTVIVGLVLGLSLAEYTTIYRVNCDVSKYGWMWGSQKRFPLEEFTCRNNENQQVQRETDLGTVWQIIKLEMGMYD